MAKAKGSAGKGKGEGYTSRQIQVLRLGIDHPPPTTEMKVDPQHRRIADHIPQVAKTVTWINFRLSDGLDRVSFVHFSGPLLTDTA